MQGYAEEGKIQRDIYLYLSLECLRPLKCCHLIKTHDRGASSHVNNDL